MTKELRFQEKDQVGEDTLHVISKADKFNKWMYDTIKPHCKGKVLEIGSGLGNISAFFLQDGFEIMLTDIRQGYCERLVSKFNNHASFLGVLTMNLVDPEFEINFGSHLERYDTVFALNVVEHIRNDSLAVKNCKKLLKYGGKLIILVPSYNRLFNRFDKELGHYRRYNKLGLSKIFLENYFDIIHRQYFNFMGIFGWYVSGYLLKKESIPKNQMKVYNILVPLFKIIDKVVFNSLGLSTIIVGKKKVPKNLEGIKNTV